MPAQPNLQRFLDAQATDYAQALAEVKAGRKRSHWMWYIFPQVQGLGFSETSRFYGIKDLAEATAYLQHTVLGPRLVAICEALLQLPGSNATSVMGSPDDVKLKSSMTLFAQVPEASRIFEQVLAKFFGGAPDGKTLQLLDK
ncbi:DUF1810 domain-containing protein [Hymenobacter sp. BT559]|uniref:DUF1810 domain-containing protein n=1 Tax=Hymenobacter sp. BT559 TaxID=2795729 RepID=UPI0018EAEC7C|nr:DUF1810 domain-containing protein [Hymenobacter sp. BT559]MBJ6141978.1 DUF1810 domain-containing protein [Hymenobacter sp. BT559]